MNEFSGPESYVNFYKMRHSLPAKMTDSDFSSVYLSEKLVHRKKRLAKIHFRKLARLKIYKSKYDAITRN